MLHPDDFGLPQLSPEDIYGGNTVEEAANIFMSVLEGRATPPQRDAVIANAAIALYAANQKAGLDDAVARATESLDSGKALEGLKKLIGS